MGLERFLLTEKRLKIVPLCDSSLVFFSIRVYFFFAFSHDAHFWHSSQSGLLHLSRVVPNIVPGGPLLLSTMSAAITAAKERRFYKNSSRVKLINSFISSY
jgi:hypothetical protein